MHVENVPIEKVIPYANNPRLNSEAVLKTAASIAEFGWRQPIVVDKDYVIIVGHTRLQAAIKLGHKTVPVHIAEDLTEGQAKAYRIADNRVGEEADWDHDKLRIELDNLEEEFPEIDIALLGFDVDELENIRVDTEVLDSASDEADDEAPEPPEEPQTKKGDIYELGNHRLMCGDSTAITDVEKLLNNEIIDMVYTDPPYGIDIAKNNALGESKLAPVTKYKPVLGDNNTEVAKDSYNLCVAMEIPTLIFWGANHYSDCLPASPCWIVWDKQNTGNFADVELAWCNLGKAARLYSQMWNGMIRKGESDKRVHPTQKPIALAEWCFDKYGKEDKNVLDLFGGSGSTLIACEKTKRTCFMMELDTHYCDVIIKRWVDFQKKHGKDATVKRNGEVIAWN